MVQAMSKEAIKSDKKKEEGPKTVKMGDRLEGRGLDTFDKKALKKALKEEEKKKNAETDDDRKKGYNSMSTSEVTEEEMEAYMLKKSRGSEDPLAKPAGGVGGFDFV